MRKWQKSFLQADSGNSGNNGKNSLQTITVYGIFVKLTVFSSIKHVYGLAEWCLARGSLWGGSTRKKIRKPWR